MNWERLFDENGSVCTVLVLLLLLLLLVMLDMYGLVFVSLCPFFCDKKRNEGE